MPFDSVDYTSAGPIYPYAYHPRAPATSKAVAGALRVAFLQARHGGTTCWWTQRETNLWLPDIYNTLSYRTTLSSTTWATAGAGYHYVPPQVTHLVGLVCWRFLSVGSDITSHWRMRLHASSGASAQDTTSTYDVASPPAPQSTATDFDGHVHVDQAEDLRSTEHVWTPFSGDNPGAAALRLELPIVNGTALRTTTAFSKIQGYAVDSLGIAQPIDVLCSAVWWESRG